MSARHPDQHVVSSTAPKTTHVAYVRVLPEFRCRKRSPNFSASCPMPFTVPSITRSSMPCHKTFVEIHSSGRTITAA